MSSAGRVLNVVVVGDGAVGKTCLLISHTSGSFTDEYESTIFENYAGRLKVDGVEYNYTLWDTAGQEGFDKLRVLCYREARVFVVCFAINSPTSLANVSTVWLPEIRRECGDKIPVVLVGTKADLRTSASETLVKKAEVKKTVRSLKLFKYVECSAKTLTGCTEVFEEAIRATMKPQEQWSNCSIL